MPAEWLDLPFAAAVRFLRDKKPTPREVFDTMKVEERAAAFTASRIAKLEALQDVLDRLVDAAQVGKTLREFIKELEGQGLGLSQAHAETVFRTNLQSAFGRGRYEQGHDPAIGRIFKGWRYRTVGDERVREAHALLDGSVFEKDAHSEVFPPWGFNCRCAAEWITRREWERDGLTSDTLPAEVQDELGSTDFASPALGIPFQPDLGGYDLGLVAHFVADQERAASE